MESLFDQTLTRVLLVDQQLTFHFYDIICGNAMHFPPMSYVISIEDSVVQLYCCNCRHHQSMHSPSGTVAAAAAGNSSSHVLLSQYVERHWNGSLPGVVVACRAADPGPD